MAEQEIGPEGLTAKDLPGARRGYDRRAVERLLEAGRLAWASLQLEHRRLLAEIERAGGLEYLSRDLGAVGAEVGRVLVDAQEAARGLRERSQADSAQRLAAAAAEAQRLVAEAEGQAFHVRADAWATGMNLLRQAVETGKSMVKEAGAEALMIRAEAEQEARRLVASARRESQDVLREARFAAERSILEARSRAEHVTPVEAPSAPAAEASPPASSGRRRHPAPEVAPTEIPDVIRVIQPTEGPGRVTRPGIDPGQYGDALAAEVEALWESGEVEAVPPAPPAPAPVKPKKRVKAPEELLPASAPPVGRTPNREAPAPVASVEEARPAPPPSLEAMSAERAVAEPMAVGTVAGEPAAAGDESPERAEPEAPPGGELPPAVQAPSTPVPPPEPPPEAVPGVVEELFARLRTSHRTAGRRRRGAVPGDETLPGLGPPPVLSPARGPLPDALELRERLVLPVHNRALRRVKESLLELQNAALDSLRTGGGGSTWEGAAPALAALGPALDPAAEEGAEAGAQAAAAFTGGEPPAAVIGARSAALAETMAEELAAQVNHALGEASGAGPLELAAAVSRVFRAWRAEEAEHWVRTVAYAAYHDSLLAGLAVGGVKKVTPVAHGLLCAECPAFHGASWDPAGEPPAGVACPPANSRCVCTLVPG